MSYYVYELVDPRTGKVFYVGKGKNARISAHEIEARRGGASLKCRLIRDIESEGLTVLKRKPKHFADEQEAFDFEATLICQYGLDNLTNVAPGGGTARGAPTVYMDRVIIATTAEGLNRTKNGTVVGIYINNQYLDLKSIMVASKKRAYDVISRRGLEWANEIAARFGVRFADV